MHLHTRHDSLPPGMKAHYFYGGWFSQWAPTPFSYYDGLVFYTAEHWMMYHKCLVNDDPRAAGEVLATTNPAEAKAIGRSLRPFHDARWQAVAYSVVLQGQLLKFTRSTPDAAEFLTKTRDLYIVEASPTDCVWGIGLSEHEAKAGKKWCGANLLGKAIMEARDVLLPVHTRRRKSGAR